MQYLMDYEDKKFQNISKEGLKLGKETKLKDLKESFKELTKWWKDALASENVDDVKISNRLENSPCVVVTSKYGWSANMEKIMQSQTLSDASKQAYMRGKRVLEVNPRHPIIKELRERVALDSKVPTFMKLKSFYSISFYILFMQVAKLCSFCLFFLARIISSYHSSAPYFLLLTSSLYYFKALPVLYMHVIKEWVFLELVLFFIFRFISLTTPISYCSYTDELG